MRIRIPEIKFELKEPFNEQKIREKVIKKTKLSDADIKEITVIRESIDARKEIIFSYIVDVETPKGELLLKKGFSKASQVYMPVSEMSQSAIKQTTIGETDRPIIVGYGPGGACQLKCVSFLFPLVFEGCSVDGADRYSGHF